MKTWIVEFTASVSVEARTEEEAYEKAVEEISVDGGIPIADTYSYIEEEG